MRTRILTRIEAKHGSFEYDHERGLMNFYGTGMTLDEMAEAIDIVNGQDATVGVGVVPIVEKEEVN